MRPRLAGARRRHELLMVDTCVIVRPTGAPDSDALDPVTLKLTGVAPTTIYTGPCQFGSRKTRQPAHSRTQHRVAVEGEELIVVRTWDASLPYTAPVILEGDLFNITKLSGDGDPNGLTLDFIVTAVGDGDFEVYRQLELQDVTGRRPRAGS